MNRRRFMKTFGVAPALCTRKIDSTNLVAAALRCVICGPMKAVILAAGKGTRMKELTNELPKPMLRVQGKPILEHILAGLQTTGAREFFIVTGWKAEVIENYFGDGKKLGVRIAYGRQLVQDGTGKAPELAKDFLGA